MLALTAFACLSALPLAFDDPADLVIWGGKIVTVDERTPAVEALAIRGDRIVAVGPRESIASLVGDDTRVLDLEGALAIPGFIEGHGHFLGIGDMRSQLDLMHARSWDEIVSMVALAVARAEPGELIRGRGWHQEKWNEVPTPNVDGVPLHDALSRVSPDNPVILTHASGHATFANAAAMQLAGVSKTTVDPPGGEVVRDAAGNPTGLFRETAASLLAPATRRARRPSGDVLAKLAQAECLKKGITSFQDAGSSYGDVELYRRLVDEGVLKLRLWVMLRTSNATFDEMLPRVKTIGYGRDRLTVRAIKRSIDGALGSHGAWLLEPYRDLPTSLGLNTIPVDELRETARLALKHGFQLCVHAIGDRANRTVLDVYEQAFRGVAGARDLRWRIEHAQHVHPTDVPRFAELGVVAAMQGVHCTSDGPWVLARLGEERARAGAYVWRDLYETGAVIVNGTDAPVEDVDPLASYYAAVTRRQPDGKVFFGDQRMTRMEALRSYTLDAAYGAFEEERKGSLAPGKLADLTILSKDILTCPEEDILTARVLYTIVGGETLYEASR